MELTHCLVGRRAKRRKRQGVPVFTQIRRRVRRARMGPVHELWHSKTWATEPQPPADATKWLDAQQRFKRRARIPNAHCARWAPQYLTTATRRGIVDPRQQGGHVTKTTTKKKENGQQLPHVKCLVADTARGQSSIHLTLVNCSRGLPRPKASHNTIVPFYPLPSYALLTLRPPSARWMGAGGRAGRERRMPAQLHKKGAWWNEGA